MRFASVIASAAAGLLIFNAAAQDKAVTVTAPRTIALISAVGDQFTYLRQKEQTGSHIEPYTRRVVTIQNGGLDAMVLRGLERTLRKTEPDAKLVYMRLTPPVLAGVYAQDRESVAIAKLVETLEKMPERANWDRIVIVTPTFQFSAAGGMGSKLQGLGVFIQPLASPGPDSELGGMEEFETSKPGERSEKSKSAIYIAPFAYTQTWILDAKTLQVLEKESDKQSVKLYDKTSTALDVQHQLDPEELARHIEQFVERSAARALGKLTPVVTVEEVKPGSKPETK